MHDYLNEHQRTAVEALQELKRICTKHEITFYLLAGSTLGAVRHGGMIPWDDDVDVGFLSEDLDRLKEVLADELDPRFEYVSYETEPGFPRMFGKILYERQSCIDLFFIARWTTRPVRGYLRWMVNRYTIESYYRSIGYSKKKALEDTQKALDEKTQNEDENAQSNEALDLKIDGFEVSEEAGNHSDEAMPVELTKEEMREKRRRKRRRARKRRLKKLRRRTLKFVRAVMYYLTPNHKPEHFIKLAKKNERYFEGPKADCYINLYSVYGMKKEKLKAEWVENPTTVVFEDDTYTTMGCLDEYLTHLYRDYMKLPPESQRVCSKHAEIYPRSNAADGRK